MTRLALIVAVAENGVIGRAGALPWRLPADLQRFKQITMGGPIMMGRRTWESIGRPLPGRTSIVVTRQPTWSTPFPEVRIAASLREAVELASRLEPPPTEAFVIGGAALYAEALPLADRLYVTRVHATVDGDVQFPTVDWSQWRRTSSASMPADERNQYATTLEIYDRLPRA